MTIHGMRMNLALTLVLLGGGVFGSSPEASAMSGQASPAVCASGPQEATALGSAESEDYAGRQNEAQGLEEFAGGDHEVVFINSGLTLLCLILIILIIL